MIQEAIDAAEVAAEQATGGSVWWMAIPFLVLVYLFFARLVFKEWNPLRWRVGSRAP